MIEKRNIVGFDELSEEWQAEAIRNGCKELSHFLEPLPGHRPGEHILWDLDDCIPHESHYKGFDYSGVIGISNSTTMLLWFTDDMETALIMFV